MSKYHLHTLVHQTNQWELSDDEWFAMRGGESWVQMRRNRVNYRFDHERSGGMSKEGLSAEAGLLARRWLVANCTDLYWFDLQWGQGEIYFRSADDAMHFKLVFHDARTDFD